MRTLELSEVNLDEAESTIKRFLANNQYRLPICIDVTDCESYMPVIVRQLENSDFRFYVKDNDVIIIE
jgi:hypothetical protein